MGFDQFHQRYGNIGSDNGLTPNRKPMEAYPNPFGPGVRVTIAIFWKYLTNTFAKSKFPVTEKLTKGALIPPTQFTDAYLVSQH